MELLSNLGRETLGVVMDGAVLAYLLIFGVILRLGRKRRP